VLYISGTQPVVRGHLPGGLRAKAILYFLRIINRQLSMAQISVVFRARETKFVSGSVVLKSQKVENYCYKS